jgi:ABC-type spermidine/putrescine transport system permease subunit II
VDESLLDAAAVAGLPPLRRTLRVAVPLAAPGIAAGALVALLFGLREVDALVFTNTGTETLPHKLYNMIHYGYDVEVGGLSFLWSLGIALLLAAIPIVRGRLPRLLP